MIKVEPECSAPGLLSQDSHEEDQASNRSSTSHLSRSPLRGAKKLKNMQCKVTLLDGTDYNITVEVSAHSLYHNLTHSITH